MIEFDKSLGSICYFINECYSTLFPNLPGYPEFSLSRAMATFWKIKVFDKLQLNLFETFMGLLSEERIKKLKVGELKTKLRNKPGSDKVPVKSESRNFQVLNKFVQTIVDISINEVKVHMLGSTKLVTDKPYEALQDLVIINTK